MPKLKRILIYPDGVTEKQVYPAGWKPNANTVLYYPLEKDGNDYSGNGHNLTWLSTPTYTTSGGTKKVVSLNGSTVGKISNLSGTYTNYTFNVWVKSTSTNAWQDIFSNYYKTSVGGSATNNVYLNYNGTSNEQASKRDFGYQYRPNGGSNTYQNVCGTTNRDSNTRYNVCVISTSSGIKIYVNNTLIASNSTTGTIILNSGYNCISGVYDINVSGYYNYFYGYMSEFIFENKTRTATEISDYYNLTKGNYGL